MAAASVLAKKRATASHFGNGGEVANLLSEAKLRKENRRVDGSVESRRVFDNFAPVSSRHRDAMGIRSAKRWGGEAGNVFRC